MKKLSEIKNQEHITSVLRSMIIRDSVNPFIAIVGGEEKAAEIFGAFRMSLNCANPQRGDACWQCHNCKFLLDPTTWGGFLLKKQLTVVSGQRPPNPQEDVVFIAFEALNGFLTFQVKEGVGTYIDPDVLSLFIYSYQSSRADVMSAARKLGRSMPYSEFLSEYINVITNILYLKSNLDVKEIDKLDALRVLSVRLSSFKLTACIRILWDAQSKTVLPEPTSIELVSLLISEALQPTTDPSTQAENPETPIKIIEDSNLEQPLDLEKMMELART